MTKTMRSIRGNMLVWISGITLTLMMALLFFAFNYTRLLGSHQEHLSAIEAASLAAATSLSRIVVADTNCGYIALTDYPAAGLSTKADDGEPLPVMGINSVMGAARMDWIIANVLNDNTMKSLATQDIAEAKLAATHLTTILRRAIKPGGDPLAKDMDGNLMRPYDDALAVYRANSVKQSGNGTMVADSFKVDLGWLSGGSTTTTSVPKPESMASLPANSSQGGCYKSFINIPAFGQDFYFIGLSSQPAIVDSNKFILDDNSRAPSIIQVSAKHTVTTIGSNGQSSTHTIEAKACAQPGGNNNTPAPGSLAVSFPAGDVPGIEQLKDLTTNPQLQTNRATAWSPQGGDWPGDGTLAPASLITGPSPTVSQSWSTALYHWLRTARSNLDLDDLKKMLETKFNDIPVVACNSEARPIRNVGLMPTAYAGASNNSVILAGIFSDDISTLTSNDDPRLKMLREDQDRAKNGFWNFASNGNLSSHLPANSFMVGVNADGGMVSGDGKSPLDMNLVHQFWVRTVETNSAGLVCVSMAKQVISQASTDINAAEQTISSAKGQISSLHQSLNANPSMPSEERSSIERQIAILTDNDLKAAEDKLVKAKSDKAAGEKALANGLLASAISDTIVQNQRTLSAKGLSRQSNNFLLAGALFTPHPLPPTSLDAIRNKQAPSGDASNTDWTASSGFYVYDMPKLTLAMQHNKPTFLSTARADSLIPAGSTKRYIFEINNDGKVLIKSMSMTPYKETPVSENQIMTICPSAITDGRSPLTSWSMVMRDQCANTGIKGTGDSLAAGSANYNTYGGKHGGQPLVGSPYNWQSSLSSSLFSPFANLKNNTNSYPPQSNRNKKTTTGGAQGQRAIRQSYVYGGLVSEFQLRSPIITNCGFPSKTSQLALTDRVSPYWSFKDPSGQILANANAAAASKNSTQGLSSADAAKKKKILQEIATYDPYTCEWKREMKELEEIEERQADTMNFDAITPEGTSGFSIIKTSGPVGPGSTMAAGMAAPTSQCPPIPGDLW
jgi:hypothetical protein